MPPGTTFKSTRPPVIWLSVAAICAKRPGFTKPGRTAIRKRIFRLCAARAVTIVQVSASGAPWSNSPLAKRVGMSME